MTELTALTLNGLDELDHEVKIPNLCLDQDQVESELRKGLKKWKKFHFGWNRSRNRSQKMQEQRRQRGRET